MILFHEGLPRSGKSYEAVVRHLVPSLKAGRPVDAYVEGLDYDKIAVASELPVDRVRELLVQVTRDQVVVIHKLARRNAFIIIDEAQNFWPTGRQRLDADITQFVAEHGHFGQDILLMGQSIKDVHPVWRRRVSQKVVFNKLDALGAESRYSVSVYKATSPERFEKVTTQVCKYDSKYFGLYASHVDSGISTANYKDSRASLFNSFLFKWGLPLVLGLAVWACVLLWGFFHPVQQSKPVVKPVAPASVASAPSPRVQVPPAVPVSFVAALNAKYRPRLAWYVEPRNGRGPVGIVEWWDGDRVRERLTIEQIVAIGEDVHTAAGLLRVGSTWVTPWPIPVAASPPSIGAQVVPVGALASRGDQP